MLKLDGRPPETGVNVGGDNNELRIELSRASVDGDSARACIDQLVKKSRSHSASLKLVDNDDLSLAVTVPVESGPLFFGEHKNIVGSSSDKSCQGSSKRGLAAASGSKEDEANSSAVASGRGKRLEARETVGVSNIL